MPNGEIKTFDREDVGGGLIATAMAVVNDEGGELLDGWERGSRD